jgi:peptidoglycan DL-endopeptidase CwlO
MSMLNDQENPWDIARRFRRFDPLASRRIGQEAEEQGDGQRQVQETFQPTEIDTPVTAGEQAFQQTLQEADQMAAQATNNAVQLAEVERLKAQREAFESEQAAQQAAQNMPQYRTDGQPFQVSGNLSNTRQGVLSEAGRYVGTPYQLGGRTVKGIDCSGLVMSVYNKAGLNVSQHSAGWQGRNIPGARTSINNLQPGDIVAWKDGSHIAIYAGNGMIVDASRSKGGAYRPLWAPQDQVYGIKLRFPGE